MRNLQELRDTGLLWLINRQVFHPRGYALVLVVDGESDQVVGWELLGDGHEPWNYPAGSENEYLTSANALLAPKEQEK